MSFKVFEQFTIGKSFNDEETEDFIFISDAYFAVVDGATAKNSGKYAGEAPGRAIGKIIIKALNSVKPNFDFEQVFAHINQEIRETFYSDYKPHNTASEVDIPTASVAIVSIEKEELWVLGDCQVVMDGKVMNFSKSIDIINARYRGLINQIAILKGASTDQLQKYDVGRQAILESLKNQRLFQNSTRKIFFLLARLMDLMMQLILLGV